MTYYWTCPVCGSNLDPGESCNDCKSEKRYERVKAITAAGFRSSNQMARRMLTRSYDNGMLISLRQHFTKV